MAVQHSCWLWKPNREEVIRARRSQASISFLASHSNFTLGHVLSLSLFNPSSYFLSLLFRPHLQLRLRMLERVLYLSLSLSTSFSYSYSYNLPLSLSLSLWQRSPFYLATTRLSTYLSPHASLCLSIRLFFTLVFTPSLRFFIASYQPARLPS